MNSLVLVVLAAAVAVAAAGPAPGPEPGPVGPVAPAAPGSPDQESQASEAVSKRGAARLTPVAGNSIVDNTVSSAPPQQLQQLQQQPAQQQLSYSSQQQPQAQPQQQPLYAPHPYSFVAPQPHPSFFQYQPALPALPPMSLLHSKYHAGPGKHVLQYVPQPYFQVPQYQAPVMYIIPQPQPQPQSHAHHGQQGQQGQQGEQGQQAQQVQPQHQPHYVMVLPAPQPAFQYYNHPQLALPPQQLFSFYPGPHHPQQPQPQQVQALQAAHPQHPQHPQHAQHAQHAHQPQTRFYPEQQPQLVFQQGDDSAPHFVPKQGLQGLQGLQGPLQAAQNPVGLEAPAPPQYGARVPQPQQSYKTIIKA